MRELRADKSATVDLEIIAHEPDRLRMEVTGPFGAHVASIAVRGEKAQLILSPEKRYVVASASSGVFLRTISIPLFPNELMSVLFDRSLAHQPSPAPRSERAWACKTDAGRRLSSCVDVVNKISIDSIELTPGERRIRIETPEAKVEVILEEATAKVESGDRAFNLEPPEGFKQEVIEDP